MSISQRDACTNCGYDRNGSPPGVCPECGRREMSDEERRARSRYRSSRRAGWKYGIALSVLTTICITIFYVLVLDCRTCVVGNAVYLMVVAAPMYSVAIILSKGCMTLAERPDFSSATRIVLLRSSASIAWLAAASNAGGWIFTLLYF